MKFTAKPAILLAGLAASSSATAQLLLGGAPENSNPLSVFGPLIEGLSASCLTTFASFVTNQNDPLTTCLGIPALFGTVLSMNANDSIIPFVDNYFSSSICGQASCSPQTLQNANQTINSQCSPQDLAINNGVNGPVLFRVIIDNYYTIKNTACLSDAKNNQNCIVQDGYSFQNITGLNVSVGSLVNVLEGRENSSSLYNFAQNTTALCTDCNKALLSSVFNSLNMAPQGLIAQLNASMSSSSNGSSSNNGSTAILANLVQAIDQKCGASYLDGTMPSQSLVQNTSQTDAKDNAAAYAGVSKAMLTGAVAMSGLVGVGLAVLA